MGWIINSSMTTWLGESAMNKSDRATSRGFLDMVVDPVNARVLGLTVTTAPTTGTSATAIKGWFSYRSA
jgi:hypothetical protein